MHDSRYKKLYAFPRIFEHLVRALAPPWADRLDFPGSRRLSAEYPGNGNRRARYGDMAWLARFCDGARLLIPIEFQTAVDPAMPLRIANYASHALLEWTNDHPLSGGAQLPLTLPIVVYGGTVRWRVPATIEPLYGPVDRSRLEGQLSCRYHVLDEQRGTDPLPGGNLVTHLVEAVRARSTRGVIGALERLRQVLGEDEGTALDRAITDWVRSILINPPADIAAASTLKEIIDVLKPTGKWEILWFEDGIAKGIREGRKEGIRDGLREGRRKGIREGIQEGRKKGLREGRDQGHEQALHQVVAIRFGDAAVRALADLPLRPSGPPHIRKLISLALACDTAEEFIARLETDHQPPDTPTDRPANGPAEDGVA